MRSEDIGRLFIELTKYPNLAPSGQMKGEPEPPLELACDSSEELIDLPAPKEVNIPNIGLRDAIENRESRRRYSKKALSLDELSFLLWCTQGVKEFIPGQVTLRTVPSAGARHALETYVLVNNVKGVKPGLYRFLATEHKLAVVDPDPKAVLKVSKGCLGQTMIKDAAVTFIWVAVASRMSWRYSQRGYRYIHLDAGHVCQNFYLAAEAIDCGVCAIGAYSDDEMNAVIGLDGQEQFVIYIASLGKV